MSKTSSFFLALRFLTILPVGEGERVSYAELQKSVIYFPLVGMVQGILLWGSSCILYWLFPTEAASGLLLLFWILMTGGLHLDGLADTVDGLAGGKEKKEILRIMGDSTIGSFGVVALIIVLILKLLAIYSLSLPIRSSTLFMTPIIGKGSIVLLNFYSGYARDEEGLGKAFVEGTTARELSFAVIFLVFLSFFLTGFKGLVPLITIAFLIYMAKRYFLKKLGGVTGDIIGAVVEISETIYLLGSLI